MFDAHALFKNRFSAHMKEMSRYLRYIFNGHIAVALLFLVSAMSVYYQQWLTQLPENFPAAWVIGIIFGLIVSHAPVSTLLQEADLVFLIPAEHKMHVYFRNALIYSYVSQLLPLLFVSAAVSPLYFHAYPNRGGSIYFLTFILLLIFKVWHLIVNWWMLKVRDISIRHTDQTVRLLLNCAIFFFIVKGEMTWVAVTTILLIGVFLYDLKVSRNRAGVAWDILVEKDQNRMQLFYRIANMFTDVPHLKNRTKKRRWLVALVSKVPFMKKHTYNYLYRITFVRSGDYLGMYIRLIIIGGLFIYYVPNVLMKVLFALLFIYMSCFQMMTLYQHYRTNIWLDLYPVGINVRRQAVTKWIFQLTFVQIILFSIIFVAMQMYIEGFIVFLSGLLFTVIFVKSYVKRKLV